MHWKVKWPKKFHYTRIISFDIMGVFFYKKKKTFSKVKST